MPWDEKKKLLQLQVEPEFLQELKRTAKENHRSLASECIWLIEQGIARRERMEELLARSEQSDQPYSAESPPAYNIKKRDDNAANG